MFSHFHQMRGTVQVEIGCPACGTRLKRGNILEDTDEGHLSHFECEGCSNCSLALMYPSEAGISAVVVTTDLNLDDIVRMRNSKPISADDIIALHQFLNRPDAAMLLARSGR